MRLLIHAKNVTGLGAVQVVVSFLEALHGRAALDGEVTVVLPSFGRLTEVSSRFPRFKFSASRKSRFRRVSRFLDCVFPGLDADSFDAVITFGDVPIRTPLQQIVLMHRPGLLRRELTRGHVEDRAAYLMRWLVSFNAEFADAIVVQTPWMAKGIASTYPKLENRVTVFRQPVPATFASGNKEAAQEAGEGRGLRLLYPAGYYPYKNHELLSQTSHLDGFSSLVEELILTIEERQTECTYSDEVSFVGYLSPERLKELYRRCDAIVFPSLAESYGLPLIEGMVAGKPIVVADLPYSRDACGEEAIYFDPNSRESLLDALQLLAEKLESGWRPEWRQQLERLPDSWDDVVDHFLGLLKTPLQ